MSFHALPSIDPVSTLNKLTNSKLILPLISIGNISQFTIDLLINSLPDVELVGRLDDLYLYPFASPIDYSEDKTDKSPPGISSPLEIYYCESLNITFLQQRSPILPGFSLKFLSELIKPFTDVVSFSKILILQSSDQGLKDDKYSSNKFLIWSNDLSKNFKLLELNDKNSMGLVSQSEDMSPVADCLVRLLNNELGSESMDISQSTSTITTTGTIPTAPSAVNLLKKLNINEADIDKEIPSKTIPEMMILSIFAYEGDNMSDAELLASKVLKLYEIDEVSQWKKPRSWSKLYGDRAFDDYDLYT